jgi:hypothetical protein
LLCAEYQKAFQQKAMAARGLRYLWSQRRSASYAPIKRAPLPFASGHVLEVRSGDKHGSFGKTRGATARLWQPKYDDGIFHEASARMNSKISALFAAAFAVALGLPSAHAANAATLWTDIAPPSVATPGARDIVPDRARTMALNFAGMATLLSGAPLERDVAAPDSWFEIELPLPEGGYTRFRLVESSIMDAGLAKRYPMLKAYVGHGFASRRNARMSIL